MNQKEIFEDIMRKHYTRLLSYVRSIVGNETAAQDVAQEAFISAYNSFNGYSEQGKIFPWLKTIARNAAYKFMQRERKYACLSLSEPAGEYDNEELNLAGYIADDNRPPTINQARAKNLATPT